MCHNITIVQVSHKLYSTYFSYNDTATTDIYTLSLHDALPICRRRSRQDRSRQGGRARWLSRDQGSGGSFGRDRKSTRLNSSHITISYAVFCLKKKKYNYYTYLFILNYHQHATHLLSLF